LNKELLEIKEECESSLKSFAKWVSPDRYYGEVHNDMFDFFQYGEHRCKLALIPRDHQKSWCAAVTAAWYLTIKPWTRINYVSWSESLVNAQMTSIEQLLYSDAHRELWSDHLNFEKDPRKNIMVHRPTEGWNRQNFFLDHPSRKERMVRDPSVRATTAKSGNTGMHSDLTIFDDLVTDENWDTQSGKEDVLKCYKSFAKINSSGGQFIAVGTKYSEDDLYSKMLDIEYKVGDKTYKRWDVFERVVEDSYRRTGDGNFVWAKQQMPNGEWYGFDEEELAIKKADALIDGDLGLFFGQYYNDPSDESTHVIKNSDFKYIDLKHLEQQGSSWYYKDKKLKLYAAADLAWTDSTSKDAKRRDFTAVSVVGIDDEGFIYVLALDRFQTDKPEMYYNKIVELQEYWQFKKITIETNSAGKFIKNFLTDEVRRNGGRLEIEGKVHTSHSGKKEERVAQSLHHRYRNGTIYHTKGGFTKLLEEELKLVKPPHDDLKDVLAIAVSECVAPLKRQGLEKRNSNIIQMSRFGGGRRSRRA
jgi:phage terminase large subunit-like protein